MLDGDDARQLTGQAGGELAHRCFQLLRIHGGNGADDRCFLLGTVGDHDHFVELVGLGRHFHQDFLLGADGDFVVFITQETDDQDIGGLDADLETAGVVRHDAAGLSFHRNESTGDRRIRLVQDLSLYADVLGGRFQAEPQQQAQDDGPGTDSFEHFHG